MQQQNTLCIVEHDIRNYRDELDLSLYSQISSPYNCSQLIDILLSNSIERLLQSITMPYTLSCWGPSLHRANMMHLYETVKLHQSQWLFATLTDRLKTLYKSRWIHSFVYWHNVQPLRAQNDGELIHQITALHTDLHEGCCLLSIRVQYASRLSKHPRVFPKQNVSTNILLAMLERNTTDSSMKPCELNYLVEILGCFQENCFLLAIQDGNNIGCLMNP